MGQLTVAQVGKIGRSPCYPQIWLSDFPRVEVTPSNIPELIAQALTHKKYGVLL
ncbi:hypothetical protein J0895_16560 [Phormidium pseudopriestleyi FRX01]|uniref:Uncharacterized protein n=1 Tax=Phormidium pseudopriestleyi FRX01 TaxID=1759528 RepID=A0ABS3FU89_9CYAN|nr:hypothetical protein [Phormidium pseudopriestleyi]MBO0350675.1 hypothetical protein [Phormidium pseudopriestleyi FRX01]